LGNQPLMRQYPSLYHIVRRKNDTVASILSTIPLNVSFRRALVGHNLALRYDLVNWVVHITSSSHRDSLSGGSHLLVSSLCNRFTRF
jgi:hypothetical protein